MVGVGIYFWIGRYLWKLWITCVMWVCLLCVSFRFYVKNWYGVDDSNNVIIGNIKLLLFRWYGLKVYLISCSYFVCSRLGNESNKI